MNKQGTAELYMSLLNNTKGGEDMKRKGFTLIELLVVIAIIGILATIGLVALNGAREKARDATRKSDISQVKTALVLYADDNSNQYPAGPDDSITGDGIFDTTEANNPVYSAYISKAIADPTNSGEYKYVYESCLADSVTNGGFRLYTRLESPGTGGPYYFWITGDGRSGDGDIASAMGSCG